MESLLTTVEVAHLLNVKIDTIYILIRTKQLPAVKVGGQWRFQAHEIQDWINELHIVAQQVGSQ